MNDHTNSLHPWIEPELEARLTALVLGEASDFEREELERIIAERPELGLYRKRLEVMHRMLRDVAKGESAEEQGEWKLGAERRAAVLARLRGEVGAEAKVVVMSGPKVRLPWVLIGRIAACFAVIGLVLSLILRSMTTVLGDAERSKNNAMAFAYSDGRETLSRSDRHGGVSVSGSYGVPFDGSDLRKYPPAQKEWQHYPAAAEEKSAGERKSEQFALNEPANSNFGTTTASPAPAKVGDREMALGLEGANTFTGGVTISGGGLVVSDPAPSTRTEVETRGTIGGRDNTTAVKSESLGTAVEPAPTTSTLDLVDADDDGVDRLSRSKEMSELAESEVVQVQEGKDQRSLRRESLVAAAPGAVTPPLSMPESVATPLSKADSPVALDFVEKKMKDQEEALAEVDRPVVVGAKGESQVSGTISGWAVVAENQPVARKDVPVQAFDVASSDPVAAPAPAPAQEPVAAAKPMSPAPAEVDLAIGSGGVMTKVGAGNLTLNGGVVIAESPKSELRAGQNGYTGDTQVVAGTVSGSGSVALRGGTSRTGEVRFNQSGATTPAEPELAKRKRDGAAEDEKGGEVSEGEAPVVSVTATSSFSVSSTEVPQVKDINGVAMAIDGKNVMDFDGFVTVDENERTKDQAIRGELPSAIEQSGNASGTVNFGAGVSTIGNLSGFFEVTETSSSMDPETAARLKKMRYLEDDGADANDFATEGRGSSSTTNDIAHRIDKLKTIIIPSVEFNDTPLRDALEFLQERSVELDFETDPARKGIQIVADAGILEGSEREVVETEANKSDGFGFEPNGGSAGDTRISLRLSNVPLAEALRYTTSLAQLKYKVEQNAVRIVPLSTPEADLFTNVYTVPPTFLSVGDAAAAGGGSAGAADPFADPVSAGASPAPGGRTTAKQILESAGISFPEGASAIYNAETSQLIVRNTPDQTELVEAYVDSVAGSDEKEGEHLFTRHFLGGATSLRGFDYRDVGQRSDVDKSVQDILALTPQVGQNSGSGAEVGLRFGNSPISEGIIDDQALVLSTLDVEDGEFLKSESGAGLQRDKRDSEAKPSAIPPVDPRHQPTPAALDETSTDAEPFSTFSLHVSDVSFQLAKAALASGKWPEANKIRIEEFVNAFDYGDPMPGMGERVACRIDQAAHPFLQQRNLVRIALRTAEAGRSSGTPLRLTLLLDSSGSMERPDRRETLRRAVTTLAGLLVENDRITLVSFARQPRLVADAVPGNEAMKLAETVAALPSEGGTNLEAALQLAFEKAREHQEPNAQNRIVLLTDGAANLGDAKAESLGQRVELMREAGIAFDAAGFGAEGLNDEILEALTRKGDGRYYLLDRPEDAEDAFAKQIAGALRPAAKNVKVQVEFNPDRVKSYKLLGFEKHRLATEDFRNDAVDAAEMAAAEAGVAVYQIEPIPGGEGDLGSVSVRFRDLDSGEMVERRWGLAHLPAAPSAEQGGDAILLATVASQFAAKLAGGPLGDVVDLGELARLAAELPESERVKELRTMIEQARGLEGDR